MSEKSEKAVLECFRKINFPGIKLGERNPEVCDYLKKQNYPYTPDLVAGPKNIELAPVEGLFFIDVMEPSSDLLFKSKASKQLTVNISETFQQILQETANEQKKPNLGMLPNVHHQLYLEALNKKLDKYAHQRKFSLNNKLMVTTNIGIVQHFNLGNVVENNIANVKGLITLIDYIRFYGSLAPSDNIDLLNAETMLLTELLNKEQKEPCILMIGREWSDLPSLFLMIHATVSKNNKDFDIGIILVNTTILDKSDGNHPVHKWFANAILNKSKKHLNKDFSPTNITIGFNSKGDVFS